MPSNWWKSSEEATPQMRQVSTLIFSSSAFALSLNSSIPAPILETRCKPPVASIADCSRDLDSNTVCSSFRMAVADYLPHTGSSNQTQPGR